MPKQEVGSTKWLGNKMKAKGLQKLRWYCQMCQKQCRDENGFKCHRMSDGHQRQMQVFTQDPNKFMDEFSQEFELGFMDLMSHSYRSTRVLANTVYCDFISNRHHTHMNSTIWVTLSNFVQYLGRTNQCKIDKTPKGWYLEYLDNSPEARMRAAQKAEMEKNEQKLIDNHEKKMQEQITDAVAAMGGMQESEYTELQRQEGDAPIAFAMGGGSSSSSAVARGLPAGVPAPSGEARSREGSRGAASRESSKDPKAGDGSGGGNVLAQAFAAHSGSGKRESSRDGKEAAKSTRKLSAMESIRLENEAAKRRKAKESRAPEHAEASSPSPADNAVPWLAAGLVCKVMHQDLGGGKYYRKKGKVEKVHDRFSADVRMVDTKDLIRLDQEMMETVIPGIGKTVKVIKGTHKGWKATMKSVDFDNFCVTVELSDGTVMEGMGYDEVCKVED
eukprot:TRINITY_DN25624_c0_g6_i1.p1 TRINITY_DN25624_c0_g6~~TRINITY_DN25624_c0_g6_i1.p1  ORF type:complete len:471 (+),score=89.39 TRINITY_DN25624_c0_g6_i1:79-1413(+)